MHFQLELETTAVLRYTSLETENTGNGLRRFTLHDSTPQERGWVLLNDRWIEVLMGAGPQEFILLSEASRRADTKPDSREYNAMMIIWKDRIAERAGLGKVVVNTSMAREKEWKEILLG